MYVSNPEITALNQGLLKIFSIIGCLQLKTIVIQKKTKKIKGKDTTDQIELSLLFITN